MKTHCCEIMTAQIEYWECDIHKNKLECVDALLDYNSKFDEYGIIIHDGGSAVSSISFCPYCGTKLPESKRDEWFDTLEKMGFDNPGEQDIPKEFLTDEWYSKNRV